MNKTWIKKPADIQSDWRLVDASGQSLGRLASQVAYLLSGKYKAEYTPHVPNGDYVVIINSNKVVLTGKKWEDKKYYSKSRYIGSLKETTARQLDTDDLIKRAVTGMLPKNKHRQKFLRKLRIFKDQEHKHKDKDLKEYSLIKK